MPAWRPWSVAHLIAFISTCQCVQAQSLSDYFPSGVPGYATAPGVTVTSRVRPEYDNPGTRIGLFMLHPGLAEDLGYDDNVFGGSAKRGSWLIGTHPSLLLGADRSDGTLGGYFDIDDTRYLDQPSQSRTDWTASLGGTFDIDRDRLTIAFAHLSQHQDRTELDALPSDTPVAWRADDIRANYEVPLGRVSITPGLEFTTWRYGNTTIFGQPAPQGYRDRNVAQASVTTRYGVAPQRDIVVVVRTLDSHDVEPQAGQPTHDFTGYQMLAGLDDKTDGVWGYRLLLGWEVRDFAAPQYATHSAPIAVAELVWNPTGLTTITASLTRSIEEPAQEGVVAYTTTRAKFTIDHEYQRDLLFQLSAGFQHIDYLDGGGTASAFMLGAGATWLINRHMRLSASYDFYDQHSAASANVLTTGSYVRSIALLTLRLGL
jgi:hypothetical protein